MKLNIEIRRIIIMDGLDDLYTTYDVWIETDGTLESVVYKGKKDYLMSNNFIQRVSTSLKRGTKKFDNFMIDKLLDNFEGTNWKKIKEVIY